MNKHKHKLLSYFDFWIKKGNYGVIRATRMLERKIKRHNRRSKRKRIDWSFTCEMGCEYCTRRGYCNGDC